MHEERRTHREAAMGTTLHLGLGLIFGLGLGFIPLFHAISHTDLSGSTLGPPLPAHNLCLPCPILAGQQELTLSECPTRPICHCRETCQEILWQNRDGSLGALRISGISTMPQDGKWLTTPNAAHLLIPSNSRLSRRLVLSTTAHFHLKH